MTRVDTILVRCAAEKPWQDVGADSRLFNSRPLSRQGRYQVTYGAPQLSSPGVLNFSLLLFHYSSFSLFLSSSFLSSIYTPSLPPSSFLSSIFTSSPPCFYLLSKHPRSTDALYKILVEKRPHGPYQVLLSHKTTINAITGWTNAITNLFGFPGGVDVGG